MRAAEGGQRNVVRSRLNATFCLPLSSASGRSPSRQSSLPINRYYQQTATDYCPEVQPTWSTRAFFVFHKLRKRFLKARVLEQWYLARCLGASRVNKNQRTRRTGRCFRPDSAFMARTVLYKHKRKTTSTRVSVELFPVRSRCGLFFLP